jgi:uncharacterized protein (UPF0335 family)
MGEPAEEYTTVPGFGGEGLDDVANSDEMLDIVMQGDDPIPVSVNGVKSEYLKNIVSRIEELEGRKQLAADNIKAVKDEAVKVGKLDRTALNDILKIRKTSADDLQKKQLLLAAYGRALGMDKEGYNL